MAMQSKPVLMGGALDYHQIRVKKIRQMRFNRIEKRSDHKMN